MINLFLMMLVAMIANENAMAYPINIRVEGIRSAKGQLVVAVFDNRKDFLKKDFRSKTYPITKSGTMEISIENVPSGAYAVSMFQDENSNGSLDTNFIGIPREPYGFSNNPAIRFGPPSFDEARFTHSNSATSLYIKL